MTRWQVAVCTAILASTWMACGADEYLVTTTTKKKSCKTEQCTATEKADEEARKEKLKGKKTPTAEKPTILPKLESQGTLGLFAGAETPEAVPSPADDLAEVAQ